MRNLANKKDVKIAFFLNVSRKKLIEIASHSKILVHATHGEHFGISVVEGMALGLPVIVHKSGGNTAILLIMENMDFIMKV